MGRGRPASGFGQEDLEKLKAFFSERGVEVKCPVCGSEDFAIEGLVQAPEVVPNPVNKLDLKSTGKVLAMVDVVCRNCTHILFFQAERMGIIS